MIALDAVLMAGIATAIVGLLTWAIYTQHRDFGCAHLRIRARIRPMARPATLQRSPAPRESRAAW